MSLLSKDTDVKKGHKSAESSFFGYKIHLAMTKERIITATVVTSGEKGDGPELPKLLEISQENGINVDTIIGDGAYSVSIKSDLHQEQIAFQETDYYKEKTKFRYKIEAKNSELKNVHGYDRAVSYGITNMQMQGAMAVFTVNLKGILKLI